MLSVVLFLVCLNLVTLALAFWDKLAVVQGRMRPVSGTALLVLAFLGGSVAAKLAQGVFHHKVLDVDFTNSLNLICLLQIVVLACVWLMVSVDVSVAPALQGAGADGGAERALPSRFGPGTEGGANRDPFRS